jgi:hypothetical protein
VNENELRQTYERILARRGTRAASDVSPEEIVDVVERRGTEMARAAILNRLMASPDGRAELELVRAAVTAASPPANRRYFVPMTIAAGLLMAVVGTATFLRGRTERDQLRGDVTGVILVAPAAGAEVGDRPMFVWHAVPAARTYSLEVLDDAGNLVTSQALRDTILVLPDTVPLVAGRSYSWRVSAQGEASTVTSESRAFRSVVR